MLKKITFFILIIFFSIGLCYGETIYDITTGQLKIDQLTFDGQKNPFGVVLKLENNFFTLQDAWTWGTTTISEDPAVFNSDNYMLFIPKININGAYYYAKLHLQNNVFTLVDVGLSSEPKVSWWEKYKMNNNDYTYSSFSGLIKTSQNGFIVAGEFMQDEKNAVEIYIMKTDSTGNKEWDKVISGTSGNEEVKRLLSLTNGNFIIAGTEAIDSLSNTLERYPGIFLIEMDEDGNVIWNKSFGEDNFWGGSEFTDIAQSEDEGYYILASAGSYSSYDNYVFKVSSSGEKEWMQTYKGSNNYTYSYHIYRGIAAQHSGGFVLVGTISYRDENSQLITVPVFVKFDKDGEQISEYQYTVTDSDSFQMDNIYTAKDSGYFVTGTRQGNAWVAKIDNDGKFLWNAYIHAPDNDKAKSVSINRLIELSNGQLIVVGNNHASSFYNYDLDGSIAKLDSDGTILWQKVISNDNPDDNEYFRDVVEVNDGEYAIAGMFSSTETKDDGTEYNQDYGYLAVITE